MIDFSKRNFQNRIDLICVRYPQRPKPLNYYHEFDLFVYSFEFIQMRSNLISVDFIFKNKKYGTVNKQMIVGLFADLYKKGFHVTDSK